MQEVAEYTTPLLAGQYNGLLKHSVRDRIEEKVTDLYSSSVSLATKE